VLKQQNIPAASALAVGPGAVAGGRIHNPAGHWLIMSPDIEGPQGIGKIVLLSRAV